MAELIRLFFFQQFESAWKQRESNFLCNATWFLKENYFVKGAQTSPVCPTSKSNMQIKTSSVRWWNDTDRGTPKNLKENLMCGNKIPTRCNRLFLLQILLFTQHHYANHQELESIIQVVAACGIWCFGFQVVGMVWSWGLTHNPQLHTIPTTWKPNTTGSNHL